MYTEAINDFNEALEINPSLALAYSGRGFSYEKIGKFKEALDDFKSFIQHAKDSNSQYINQAEEYIKALEEKIK